MIGKLRYRATLNIYTNAKNSIGVMIRTLASATDIYIGFDESMSGENNSNGALMSIPSLLAYGHDIDLADVKHNDELVFDGITYRIIGVIKYKKRGYIYLNLQGNDAGQTR